VRTIPSSRVCEDSGRKSNGQTSELADIGIVQHRSGSAVTTPVRPVASRGSHCSGFAITASRSLAGASVSIGIGSSERDTAFRGQSDGKHDRQPYSKNPCLPRLILTRAGGLGLPFSPGIGVAARSPHATFAFVRPLQSPAHASARQILPAGAIFDRTIRAWRALIQINDALGNGPGMSQIDVVSIDVEDCQRSCPSGPTRCASSVDHRHMFFLGLQQHVAFQSSLQGAVWGPPRESEQLPCAAPGEDLLKLGMRAGHPMLDAMYSGYYITSQVLR
jgi:hypothetical protein